MHKYVQTPVLLCTGTLVVPVTGRRRLLPRLTAPASVPVAARHAEGRSLPHRAASCLQSASAGDAFGWRATGRSLSASGNGSAPAAAGGTGVWRASQGRRAATRRAVCSRAFFRGTTENSPVLSATLTFPTSSRACEKGGMEAHTDPQRPLTADSDRLCLPRPRTAAPAHGALTEGPRVVWVADALGSQLLQQRH